MSKTQTNLLKTIAVLMMIFHHCFAFSERVPSTFIIASGIQKLATGCRLCVSIFIAISGYGFGKKIIGEEILFRNSVKKLFQFYCVYWFAMLVTLPYGFRGGIR